jgi:hypothetical protein
MDTDTHSHHVNALATSLAAGSDLQLGLKILKSGDYLQENLVGVVNNLPRLAGRELLTIASKKRWVLGYPA